MYGYRTYTIVGKTLGNKESYEFGGFTNFTDIYIDINHNYSKSYKRVLNLNEAISTVNYQYEGVHIHVNIL